MNLFSDVLEISFISKGVAGDFDFPDPVASGEPAGTSCYAIEYDNVAVKVPVIVIVYSCILQN